ncbi:putative myosin light chain kinase DDB_G0282429 [Styela clava]
MERASSQLQNEQFELALETSQDLQKIQKDPWYCWLTLQEIAELQHRISNNPDESIPTNTATGAAIPDLLQEKPGNDETPPIVKSSSPSNSPKKVAENGGAIINVINNYGKRVTNTFVNGNIRNLTQVENQSVIEQPTSSHPQDFNIQGVLANNNVYFDENQPLRKGYKVFRGVLDGVHSEEVAVKIVENIKKPATEAEIREAKLMVDLKSHPNVILHKTSHYFRYRGLHSMYIAMEICKTNTLYEEVSSVDAKDALKQITEGLKHIDDNGLIHRDIKPQNILMTLDGKTYKVVDFGISRLLGKNKKEMTQSTDRRGTPGWGSPEFYIHEEKISKLTDIFSLGLVFYYVLSKGDHAFGKEELDWCSNIKKYECLNIDNIEYEDPDIARDLVSKMLSKWQTDRPDTRQILSHPFFLGRGPKTDISSRCERLHQPGNCGKKHEN